MEESDVYESLTFDYYILYRYTYRVGHRLSSGAFIWSKEYQFKSSPFPGQNSLQHVVIFGDMGKV